MKNITFILIIISISFNLFSQVFETEIGENKDSYFSVLKDNFLFFGYTIKKENKYAKLIKISQTGESLLQKSFISDTTTKFNQVHKLNGGYLVDGFSDVYTDSVKMLWVVFLDNDFNIVWEKKYDLPFHNKQIYESTSLFTSDNNLIVSATFGSEFIDNDFFLYKLSSTGDSLDFKIHSFQSNAVVCSFKEAPTNDKLYLTAYGCTNNGSYNELSKILKIDKKLEIDTIYEIRSLVNYPYELFLSDSYIDFVSDTTFIFAGTKGSYSTPPVIYKEGIILFDTNFNVLNEIAFFNERLNFNSAEINGLDYIDKKAIYTGGYCPLSGFRAYSITKMDSALNVYSEKYYETDFDFILNNILATQDGGVLLVGVKWLNGEDYVYVIKTDPNGNITHINGDLSEQKAKEVILYPNPATTEITIQKAVQVGNCNVEFYNMEGKKVFYQELTSNSTKIDISSLQKGSYIYKITDKNNVLDSGKWIKQ